MTCFVLFKKNKKHCKYTAVSSLSSETLFELSEAGSSQSHQMIKWNATSTGLDLKNTAVLVKKE